MHFVATHVGTEYSQWARTLISCYHFLLCFLRYNDPAKVAVIEELVTGYLVCMQTDR